MSSMLNSYTLLSGRAPLPLPLRREFSRAAQPTAATTAARVPSRSWRQQQSSRAPSLFVCRSQKNTYNIHPNALVSRSSTTSGRDWNITEDNDHVFLKLKVESTSKDKLEVATTEDQVLLVKHKGGDGSDEGPASRLDVRLLMPPGYDGKKVKAHIGAGGWLEITIPKPNHETNPIAITE